MEEQLKQRSEHLEELVKARTAELARSEEKYHGLVDDMSDSLFTLNLEGNFTYVTPSTNRPPSTQLRSYYP